MRSPWIIVFLALMLNRPLTAAETSTVKDPRRWQLPIVSQRLTNGLTVVISEDHSVNTFGISITYRIGFRLEPKGRSGFAHLFEHMMFEGTQKAPKGTFNRAIEAGGGTVEAATSSDFTSYAAAAPVSALDTILWLEADRMKALDFSAQNLQNQKMVIKEEIRSNVTNQPYGLFYWTDLNGCAFDKWENSHDGYGTFADLDAASLEEIENFFKMYYGPNNAVLAIVGDIVPAETFAKVEKYFGEIAPRLVPPPPDTNERLNTSERTLEQVDPLAQLPALAVGWKMPQRISPQHVPAAVLANLLLNGEASLLAQSLVKEKRLMSNIDGGLNWPQGDPWTYDGPTLLTLYGQYPLHIEVRTVVAAIDEVVGDIARRGVSDRELGRVKTKMESDLYSSLELPQNRAKMLAQLQTITGRADRINELALAIAAVTSQDIRQIAVTYLRPENRTIVVRHPPPHEKGKGEEDPR